jgi:hypothetical protein
MSNDSSSNADTLMKSPFQEHFNTNYVPTDAELKKFERIRTHLVSPPPAACLAPLSGS